jgi:hypothetical protein
VRYFPIESESLNEASVEAAFANCDASGLSLGQMLGNFLIFSTVVAAPANVDHYWMQLIE